MRLEWKAIICEYVHQLFGSAMSAYFLHVRNGPFVSRSDHEIVAADRQQAWKELTGVCADAAPSVCHELAQNGDWQIELLDDVKRPIFRISIIGETVDDAPGIR